MTDSHLQLEGLSLWWDPKWIRLFHRARFVSDRFGGCPEFEACSPLALVRGWVSTNAGARTRGTVTEQYFGDTRPSPRSR